MIPPVMRRLAKRPVGASGVAAEKRLAKRVGGRLTPASGALSGAKGDVVLPAVLLEAKSTVNDSLSLKLDWLVKIAGEARAVGKDPALAVTFTTGDGRPRAGGSWVLISERRFREMEQG
jgi:hypothetical protein